jgi:hypothetical protein
MQLLCQCYEIRSSILCLNHVLVGLSGIEVMMEKRRMFFVKFKCIAQIVLSASYNEVGWIFCGHIVQYILWSCHMGFA